MAKSFLDRTALALFKTVPRRAAHHLLFLAQSRPEISDRWGYHIRPIHYYEPLPDFRAITSDQITRRRSYPAIDFEWDDQLALITQLARYKDELSTFHDIFFPHDYPAEWLLNRRLALNEQYLLEAFLAFNNSFVPQLANYWICLDHSDVATRLWSNVGNMAASSFWMKRVAWVFRQSFPPLADQRCCDAVSRVSPSRRSECQRYWWFIAATTRIHENWRKMTVGARRVWKSATFIIRSETAHSSATSRLHAPVSTTCS